MKILTIIPARGGSKGVPRKNIKLLGGKPLIAWTIEAAFGLSDVVVTTDDRDIGELSLLFGLPVVWRSQELSADNTPILPVMHHVIKEHGYGYPENFFDWILLLQPTSPFRTAEDIKAAIALAEQGDCDSVISVVKVGDHHPARMYTIDGDYMKALYPDEETKRRQDLSPLYLRNGAIYLTRRDVIMAGKMWGEKVKPYLMPEERSINIDTLLDFKLAEAMLVRN